MDSIINHDLFDVQLEEDEFRVKYARKEKIYVFWDPENWGLWSSPNMRYLRKPVHRPSSEDDKGMLRDYCRRPRKTRWMDSLEPFLGFWPLRPEWIGPFACLNLIPGRLPIIWWKDGLTWHLNSDAAIAWQLLEGNLVRLGTGLLRRHITARYDWSEIRPSVLPYECGYMDHHKTSDNCAGSIYKSRNAFILLTSFVSFAIALDMSVHPPIDGTAPDWLFYAERKLDMDPGWLSELAESFVCNFTLGFRPGSYARSNICTFKQTFAAFKAANVPLFINWGFRPQWLADDDLIWRYRPCKAEARRAIDRFCDQMPPAEDPRGSIAFWYDMNASPQSVLPPMPPSILQSCSSPLPLVSNKGPQIIFEDSPESPPPSLQGEDDFADPQIDGPEVLLARIAEERVARMQSEMGSEASHRRQLESKAEGERVDVTLSKPTMGEALIVWVEQGKRVHVPYVVPREKWEDTWPFYTPEERHYSADYDEWNLIRRGDFNAGDEGNLPLEQSFYRAKAPAEPASLSELGPVVPERRSTKTMEERIEKQWKVRYFQTDEDTDWWDSSDDDDDDDDCSDTFGGSSKRKRGKVATRSRKRVIPRDNRAEPHIMKPVAPQSTRPSNPAIYSITASPLPSSDAKTILRNKYRYLMSEPYVPSRQMSSVIRGKDGEVVPGFSKPTIALKRLGIESAHHTPETTACAVDLYNYFHLAKDPKFSPTTWDFAPTLRQEIVDHAYFHYCRVNGERHVIGVRGKPLVDQWYLLVVFDARAVAELFYQQPESIRQMVQYLIQQGIPFATAKPVRRPPRIPASHSGLTLGYRPRSYQFGLSDFAAYERKKDELLSGSVGRAALMQGGIVWRLAVDTVQHKRVTSGPVSSVAWSGKNIGDLDGHTLVDDYLPMAAEDMLCGVYRVYTGMYKLLSFKRRSTTNATKTLQIKNLKRKIGLGSQKRRCGHRRGITMGTGRRIMKSGTRIDCARFRLDQSQKIPKSGGLH